MVITGLQQHGLAKEDGIYIMNELKETNKDILIRMDERQHTIFNDIKDIRKTLDGNGQEGLCTSVTKHKTYFKIMGVICTLLGAGLVTIICKLFLGG